MAKTKKTDQQLKDKLEELQHAMQSGVAMEATFDHSPTTGKSLRVGINAEMVFHGALVALLVKKGVITDREYLEAMVDGMAQEVEQYEKRISNRMGKEIKLG